MSEKFFSNSKAVFVILISPLLAVHGWALYVSGYYYYPWLDVPMHFAGGMATAIFFIWRLYYAAQAMRPIVGRGMFVVLCLGFGALVGVGWEFFEFSFDALILQKTNMLPAQLGVSDTMSDLFMDLLGAFIVGAVFIFSKAWKRQTESGTQF